MKADRPYPFVTIGARGAKRAQEGHPWVFDNEITQVNGTPEDGGLCDVLSPKGRYLGTGYYNSHSKIRVRLLSQNANDKFDQAFFARRAQYAWDYRKTVMGPDAGSCRVIFGEADRFPGLTVEIREATGEKCERCWMHSLTVGADADHPTLCARCAAVVRKLPQF